MAHPIPGTKAALEVQIVHLQGKCFTIFTSFYMVAYHDLPASLDAANAKKEANAIAAQAQANAITQAQADVVPAQALAAHQATIQHVQPQSVPKGSIAQPRNPDGSLVGPPAHAMGMTSSEYNQFGVRVFCFWYYVPLAYVSRYRLVFVNTVMLPESLEESLGLVKILFLLQRPSIQ